MIAIIDCDIGNLRSVEKALESMGYQAAVTSDVAAVRSARAVILPGVGAFGDAMDGLKASGLDDAVYDVIAAGKPFLGICIGLQMYATESEEGGLVSGLNIIPGRVVRLPDTVKVPEMGWNRLNRKNDCPIFSGVAAEAYFYFAHSYYLVPDDPADTAATTEYGVDYTSAAWRDNVYGVQFHPEKSGRWGLHMLRNFAELNA